MPDYRLYFIDPEGSIDSVEEFNADDDVEALRISRGSLARQPLELWCRSRIVETLAPSLGSLAKGGRC
jgi:hypothetical protein